MRGSRCRRVEPTASRPPARPPCGPAPARNRCQAGPAGRRGRPAADSCGGYSMALRKRDGGGGIAFGGAFDSLPAMLTDDEPPIDLPDRIRLPFVFDPVSLASALSPFAER